MLKVLSVLFHILAGFFFYMVSVLAFTSTFGGLAKAAMLAGFSAPAFVALAIGLALTRFRRWKRDTGIVLLSTSAISAFLILTMACMLASEDFRRLMPPDTLDGFSAYVTGGVVIVAYAVLGWVLLKAVPKTSVAAI